MMRSIRNPLRRVAQRYYATQLSFATPYADACGPNEFEVKASIAAAKAGALCRFLMSDQRTQLGEAAF